MIYLYAAQQSRNSFCRVKAALLPAVAVGMGKGYLLGNGIYPLSRNAQNTNLDHGVTVYLDYVAGLLLIVQHQQQEHIRLLVIVV